MRSKKPKAARHPKKGTVMLPKHKKSRGGANKKKQTGWFQYVVWIDDRSMDRCGPVQSYKVARKLYTLLSAQDVWRYFHTTEDNFEEGERVWPI